MPPPRPGFLILNEPLPSSEIHGLLGLFTFDYKAPLDRFAPSQLPDFISNHVKEYEERTAASIVVQSQSSVTLRAKLEHVLSLASSRSGSMRYNIEASIVKTYRLHDQDKAFDALMARPNVKAQVEALFRRPKQRANKVYMIVGLKTLLDASVKKEWGSARTRGAGSQISVGVILNAAGSFIPGAEKTGIRSETNVETTLVDEAQYKGEQIFAVEYRVINKRLFPNLRSSSSGITFGSIKEWNRGEGLMGGGVDTDTEYGSDEEDEQLQRLPPLSKSQVKRDGGELWEVLDGA